MRMMKGSKKGANLLFPSITIILMLVMLWARLNIPVIKTNVLEKDIEVRSEIHTMGNALDAAKLYMETALAYSTYQGCFDNLRSGGLDTASKSYQGYPLWDSSPAGKEAFDQALQKSILSNLELYRKSPYKFMSEYFVNIPTYEVAVLTEQPWKTTVGAWNSSNFWIEKSQESGERIRLEKYGFLQGEYDMDCYGIYAKGTEVYGLAREAVRKAWTDIQAQTSFTGATEDDVKNQVSAYGENINKTFVDKAWTGLYALSSTGTEYDTGVDVLYVNLKWATSLTVGPDKAEAKVTYTPEVYVKFEITDIQDGQQFPVYDGSSVIMSPMTLVYVARLDGT